MKRKKKKFKKERKIKENPKAELFKLFIRKEGKEFLFRKVEEVRPDEKTRKELLKLIRKCKII